MNCCTLPAGTDGFTGVTAMETRRGAVTVSGVEPETFPCLAEIVVLPCVEVEAKPDALIVATVVFEDAQVTLPVIFCIEPSEYVPVAVNCWPFPAGTDGLAGVTAMDFSIGAVTVSVVEFDTAPCVAEIVVVP